MTKKMLILLFILGVSSSFMSGQVAITGQIRGFATDVSGGALPNVAITATEPQL